MKKQTAPLAPVARRRTREDGLTLVELLIALALLSFVLLGIVPLFLASTKSNYSANEYTSIHILARDRLEQLMNKPFNDAALSVGGHVNDQDAKLPDPSTGKPPSSGGVPNPFTITYQVLQYAVPALDTTTTPAQTAPTPTFVPVLVKGGGLPYDYKRIDVTVRSGSGPLGIGQRIARVSGIVSNPDPTSAANLSVANTCDPGTCP
jgi:prepilin-type N-terminal cleavage/methylation domain-containing protein